MAEGNNRNDGHRRTRSAMVSSLLSHSSSSASSSAKSHSRNASAAVTPSNSAQLLAPVVGGSPPKLSSKGSIRSPSRSGTGTINEVAGPSTTNTSRDSLLGGSGVLVAAKSVEETVRTFRLYEALRNGDTMAISRTIRESSEDGDATRSSILHLAVQCAELAVMEYILSTTTSKQNATSGLPYLDINHRDPTNGNTPLHIAAQLGRAEVVSLLLKQPDINDSIHNYLNRTPLEISRNPAIFQMLQLARSMFLETTIDKLNHLVAAQSYDEIAALLEVPRVKGLLDLNTLEPPTNGGGSTLLHDAARRKDTTLIELLLLHGADPFRRDKRGKLPQDVTKDEKTKIMLKKSPAAKAAARGIEERAVLGSAAEVAASGDGIAPGIAGKEGREMKGYLKKWTNYGSGYKLRWFVLEDGVLSYYKHQDDIGSACRGAINMRIAKLHMDPQDKQRFEIHGKGSVKYHLKANHVVEAKRWYWTLNNAIQWAKDEAREEERRKAGEAERLGRIREQQRQEEGPDLSSERMGRRDSKTGSITGSSSDNKRHSSLRTAASFANTEAEESDAYEPSINGPPVYVHRNGDEDDRDREMDIEDDDASSRGPTEPPSADKLALLATSARLQLDLLSQVVLAVQFEHVQNPELTLSNPLVTDALQSYESAVLSLKELVGELLLMSKERDSYWRYRIEKEVGLRKLWEENMAVVAHEQETLEGKAQGEREKRKKAKKALKEVLRKESAPMTPMDEEHEGFELDKVGSQLMGSVIEDVDSDSDSDDGDEFFDAIDSGEVEVVTEMPLSVKSPGLSERNLSLGDSKEEGLDLRMKKLVAIKTSYKGYEDPVRLKLSMDADDRPKISLWGILKSMIGKDMTKMTLPVSFNEPTSLLQRIAEDMEYTDLLDAAADRTDSAERMVYVAAFAASEYSSTTNRVAKPFNPLLGETYEYCRPDKKYRFFVEQVSHHPPIGAAWAEAEKWDYWGESAVRSKFYGKSFDINPLGTWFLRLRTPEGTEELYTWKKVTTSVVGIITGNPTVDNYGLMEIKNWTTGDTCLLDFKARGWRGANAYEVKGRVLNPDGIQVWSIGGRWNEKIYARLSPGYDVAVTAPPPTSSGASVRSNTNSAFLVWENHPRPPAPFNLTPFSITLNALPESLRPVLCPTDTRLRPDQRAMEEGEYDLAASEKNRLEEKQRAKRRDRELGGVEYSPRWFEKSVCPTTGEEYWSFKGYWDMRKEVTEGQEWREVEDIF